MSVKKNRTFYINENTLNLLSNVNNQSEYIESLILKDQKKGTTINERMIYLREIFLNYQDEGKKLLLELEEEWKVLNVEIKEKEIRKKEIEEQEKKINDLITNPDNKELFKLVKDYDGSEKIKFEILEKAHKLSEKAVRWYDVEKWIEKNEEMR